MPPSTSSSSSSSQDYIEEVPKIHPYGIDLEYPTQLEKFYDLRYRGIFTSKFHDSTQTYFINQTPSIHDYETTNSWLKLLRLAVPTYTPITLEFLSSLFIINENPANVDDPFILFRLDNQHRVLSLEELANAYNIPVLTQTLDVGPFNANEFWKELTRQQFYDPTMTNALAIYHPTWRYLHQLIVNTVLARHTNTHRVLYEDLYLLWSIAKNKNYPILQKMMQHFHHVVNSEQDPIAFGGLITPIAAYLGINPTGRTNGVHVLTMNDLKQNGLVDQTDNGEWLFMYDNGMALPLNR